MAFRKIGGVWVKRDKKNRQYLTGGLLFRGSNIRISIYMNEKKKQEKDPDYLIYEQTLDRGYRK